MAKRRLEVDITGDSSKYSSAINQAVADTKKLESASKSAASTTVKFGEQSTSGFSKASGAVSNLSGRVGSIAKFAGASDTALGSLVGKVGNLSGQSTKLAAGLTAGAVAATALAVAGTAAVGFALKGVQQFADLTSQVRAFQRVSGASAEDASKLVFAVKRLGIDPEAAAKSFATLSKNIGSGKLDLRQYGIEVAHNKQGNVDLVGTVLNIAAAYQKTENPTVRAALANEAFKKSWVTLTPLLGKGRAELEAIFKEAGKDHQIFSQADLEAGRQYTVSISQLKAAFQGLQVEAGKALVPVLTDVATQATGIIHSLDSAAQSAGGLGGILTQTVSVGLSPFIHSAKAGSEILHGDFKKGLADAGQAATGVYSGLIDLVSGSDEATSASQKFADAQKKLGEAQGKVVAGQLDGNTHTKEYKKAVADAAAASKDLERGQTGVIDVLQKTGTAADRAAAALQAFKQAGDQGNGVFDAANKLYDDGAKRLSSFGDAAYAAANAQFAAGDAVSKLADDFAKLGQEGGPSLQQLEQDVLGVSKAAGELAEQKLGPLATESQKASASLYAQVQSLQALKEQYPQLGGFIDQFTGQLVANAQAAGNSNVTAQQAKDVLSNLATQYGITSAELQPLIDKINAQAQAQSGGALTQQQAIIVLQSMAAQYGFTKDEVQLLTDKINAVPPTANTTITADTFTAQTQIDTFINQNTGREIHVKVNPVYGSSDPLHPFGVADGGIFKYAAGGIRESHVAQVAPAGAMRLWAEPETGGEAYIPLAASKRARSARILMSVADQFGMTAFANGGMTGPGGMGGGWTMNNNVIVNGSTITPHDVQKAVVSGGEQLVKKLARKQRQR